MLTSKKVKDQPTYVRINGNSSREITMEAMPSDLDIDLFRTDTYLHLFLLSFNALQMQAAIGFKEI